MTCQPARDGPLCLSSALRSTVPRLCSPHTHLADPGLSLLKTKQSRERGEDTNALQSWMPHQHPCLGPGQVLQHSLRQVPAAVFCRDTLVPK